MILCNNFRIRFLTLYTFKYVISKWVLFAVLRSYAFRTTNAALAGTIGPTTWRMHTAGDRWHFYYLLGIWTAITLSRHSYPHSHRQICYQHEEAPALFVGSLKRSRFCILAEGGHFEHLQTQVWQFTTVILSEVNGNTFSTNSYVF